MGTNFFNREKGISAGSFEDRPFLDRINPFTPIQSKRFVPSEEAQILLDNFKERTGKNVNVLPLRENFNKFKIKPESNDTLKRLEEDRNKPDPDVYKGLGIFFPKK